MNEKNLRQPLCVLALALGLFHVALGTLMYFIDIDILQMLDYVLAGILAVTAILYYVLKGPKLRLDLKQGLLAAMVVWLLLSCASRELADHGNQFARNWMPLFDTLVLFLVVFPLGRYLAQAGTAGTLKALLHAALFTWSALMVYILMHAFRNRIIDTPNGGQIGMNNMAALCLNCNPNTTGVWAMVAFLASFCLLMGSGRVPLKALCTIECLINYAVLVLSKSRTAFLSTCIGAAAVLGVVIWHARSWPGRRVRLAVSLGGAVAFGIAFYLLYSVVLDLHESATHLVAILIETGQAAIKDVSMVSSSFSGRTDVWLASMRGIVSSARRFFFGVTPASVPNLVSLMSDGNYDMYTHNQFLEIAAALGVPALGMFIAWFLAILRDSARLLLSKDSGRGARIALILVLTLMLANMAEATLMFYRFVTSYVFFFLCGWLTGLWDAARAEDAPARQKVKGRR